jgi:hypothetical protein
MRYSPSRYSKYPFTYMRLLIMIFGAHHHDIRYVFFRSMRLFFNIQTSLYVFSKTLNIEVNLYLQY